jgi:type I restriction enzyme S subunit
VGRFFPLGIETDYLYYLLSTDAFQSHLLKLQTGTDLPHVSASDILSFPVALAPMSEQKRIASKVSELITKATEVEKTALTAANECDRLEQSILAKAFRGELIPQDPNDEPASALLERIKNQTELLAK